MKMTRTRTAAVAAAATGLLGVGGIVPAIAQESDGDSAESADRRADRHEAFVEALAAELEMDVDTVAAAVDAAHERMRSEAQSERLSAYEERLDAAVEDGELTQEQADAILEAHEDGVIPFGRGDRGGFGGHRGHHRGPTMGGFGGFGMPFDDTDTDTGSDPDPDTAA